MGTADFIKLCRQQIWEYMKEKQDKTDEPLEGRPEDVIFVVWSCKTLQNNKALLSTIISDGMYYEMTYDGNEQAIYMDAYKKWENRTIFIR